MLFNSLQFAFFFPVVSFLYFVLPHQWRWLLLLTASCVFYMAFIPSYILILLFTIIVDYIAGLWIESSQGRTRLVMLLASLAANIGILAVFKYYHFLAENLATVLHLAGSSVEVPFFNIILPIGLSFHTFQAMSYTIEVYRGRQQAERHFGIYALYVMFYPQLVAGPIERPQNLLHQFREEHVFDYARVADGLKLMAMGLFKKVFIADQLAPGVNRVFNHAGDYHGLSLLLAILFFAFQIYYDFSGYSDIAIGSARVMGFKLMQNFDTPYLATSIADFWRRWHISLSTWFRDYVYLPLGGSRVSGPRWAANIMIVFLISGLWHGANWTFVVWGAIHGCAIIAEGLPRRFWGRSPSGAHVVASWPMQGLAMATTFAIVCLAWVFFRAATVGEAWQMLIGATLGSCADVRNSLAGKFSTETPLAFAVVKLSFLAAFQFIEYVDRQESVWARIAAWPAIARFAVYYMVVYSTILAAVFQTKTQFIYFQF
jgi:D-alanyl-lipoteichoic acid acyltransferase DltB (MBOAT superfamily)